MFLKLLDGVTALPLWTHAAAAVATVASFQWTRGWLEAGYAASRRPVDFATGQTAFSGEKIKSYFAHTQKTGIGPPRSSTTGSSLPWRAWGCSSARSSRGSTAAAGGRGRPRTASAECAVLVITPSPVGWFRSMARESFAPRPARDTAVRVFREYGNCGAMRGQSQVGKRELFY